jgi:CRP/FNR family transcriptional regulator, cyclic AMP receptor protein
MSEPDTGSLKSVGLLQGLPMEVLTATAKDCGWRAFAAQEQIIDRQSETTDVFFIVEGKVRVVNYSVSGREITLDDIEPGGHFGELAAIDGAPRSASVMALTPCRVALLPQERFLALIERHPSVAIRVMRDMAVIIRNSTERIMDLSTLAANNRVQADLLRLAVNNMADDDRASISPIPVHGDVASRVSTTRETVARVMNDLARQGVVERRKDALVVNDVERLRDMVEEVRGE